MDMVANRKTLPPRRFSETLDLAFGKAVFQVSVGYFEDIALVPDPSIADAVVLKRVIVRTPGEVFITGAKAGSEIEAIARDGAVLISIGLQHGVPLDVMAGAVTRDPQARPMTVVGAVIDQMIQRRLDK
jgi:hypothetical protein